MKIKFLVVCCLLAAMTFGFAQEDEKEETDAITMYMVFTDINALEGDVSLIFEDASGEDVWFDHFDVDVEEYDFYTIKVKDELSLPEYTVNADKVGQIYEITYVIETVAGEYSGELEEMMIVKDMVMMEPPDKEPDEVEK
jgi:hypothetical protein